MIVSNISPLIVLKKARATRVLTEIFQEIYIPPAVWAELKVREEEFFKGMRQLRIKEVDNRRHWRRRQAPFSVVFRRDGKGVIGEV